MATAVTIAWGLIITVSAISAGAMVYAFIYDSRSDRATLENSSKPSEFAFAVVICTIIWPLQILPYALSSLFLAKNPGAAILIFAITGIIITIASVIIFIFTLGSRAK